ncbi:50S ribosomal protein L25 [bioreactor metagenome]|uniref:50S ribosomal protein L25 n=1 Tax=bioreactor metagenome TaxID=1076179 RepID=A0A644YWV9_9ZZZZ
MTKEKHQLKAQVRTLLGRKVKQLRKDGLLPATIYGKGFDSISVQINLIEAEKIFNEVGESGLVELMVDEKEKLPILFRNPQYHPIDEKLIHIDCYKVNLKEKISAMVPIEFIGESQAVKDGNTLVTVTDEVEVEALPADLPESIEVDLTVLENLESTITVADLKIDKSKVEILTDAEQLIAKVEEPRVEEEEPAAEVSPEDVEVTAQKGEQDDSEEKSEEKEE